MSRDFQIIQIEIEKEILLNSDNRMRDQLVGAMHAHNELTILNRMLMFSMNSTGEGELHDSAQSVQMWCLLQVLAGKLVETWNMLSERFLKAIPEDPALTALQDEHRRSLDWLKNYFGDKQRNTSSLRTIRDKTAFHFDRVNLTEAISSITENENLLYLAQHPANSLYYLGSSLVFRSVFAGVADQAKDTTSLTHSQRTIDGFRIAIEDAKNANWHMHLVLYGIISSLLEKMIARPAATLDQVRIWVRNAPSPEEVGIPTFIDIGEQPPK